MIIPGYPRKPWASFRGRVLRSGKLRKSRRRHRGTVTRFRPFLPTDSLQIRLNLVTKFAKSGHFSPRPRPSNTNSGLSDHHTHQIKLSPSTSSKLSPDHHNMIWRPHFRRELKKGFSRSWLKEPCELVLQAWMNKRFLKIMTEGASSALNNVVNFFPTWLLCSSLAYDIIPLSTDWLLRKVTKKHTKKFDELYSKNVPNMHLSISKFSE